MQAFYIVFDREDPRRCKWDVWNIWPVALVSKKLYFHVVRRNIVKKLAKMFNGLRIKMLDGTFIKPRMCLHSGDLPAESDILEVKSTAGIRSCYCCDFDFDSKSEKERNKQFSLSSASFKRVSSEGFLAAAEKAAQGFGNPCRNICGTRLLESVD